MRHEHRPVTPRRLSFATAGSRLAGTAAGAALGALPGIVAYKTFLAPVVNHDLSDINNAFTFLLAFGIGVAGAAIGAIAGYRYAARRSE